MDIPKIVLKYLLKIGANVAKQNYRVDEATILNKVDVVEKDVKHLVVIHNARIYCHKIHSNSYTFHVRDIVGIKIEIINVPAYFNTHDMYEKTFTFLVKPTDNKDTYEYLEHITRR